MISVVIPVYNSAETIRRCIDSCLAQTYDDFEVVCVDDGSIDESATILSTYDNRIRVLRQANAGVVTARKNGVEAAWGEWVYFLDSDDYLPSTALSDLAALVGAETDVVFGNQVVVQRERTEERVLLPNARMSGLEYVDYSLAHGQGTIGGKMFRRALCLRLAIDRRFQLNEDLLMNVQIGLMAREIAYLPKPNYYYWWMSEGSLAKQISVSSVSSVLAVNRRVKELLLSEARARPILRRGYVPYTIRNAAQLYTLDFHVPEMRFVLKELRRIAFTQPCVFLREAMKRRSCFVALSAEVLGLWAGRLAYRVIMKLRG